MIPNTSRPFANKKCFTSHRTLGIITHVGQPSGAGNFFWFAQKIICDDLFLSLSQRVDSWCGWIMTVIIGQDVLGLGKMGGKMDRPTDLTGRVRLSKIRSFFRVLVQVVSIRFSSLKIFNNEYFSICVDFVIFRRTSYPR